MNSLTICTVLFTLRASKLHVGIRFMQLVSVIELKNCGNQLRVDLQSVLYYLFTPMLVDLIDMYKKHIIMLYVY